MKRLPILLALIALPSLAGAATYYVDCAADGDAGAGTSTAANVAWKTVAKVNASSFSAGDSILLNRGCTWRETLTVPSSGSAGSPITFGAYGNGVNPTINGSDLLTSFTTETTTTDAYVTLDANTKFMDTPATADNRLTGTDFRLEVDVALDDYVTGAEQALLAKDDVTLRHYSFKFGFGSLRIEIFGATNNLLAYPQVDPSLTDGARYQLRVDVDVDDGAAGSTYKFYSATNGVDFSQIGATVTEAITPTLNTNDNTLVTVGRRANVSAPAAGKFYRARAWSDRTGTTLVYDMNLNDYASGSTWESDTTGETWTLRGTPTVTAGVTSSLYYKAVATDPKQLLFDGVRLPLAASKLTLTTGKWWWDDPNGRAYLFDDPTGHTVEASSRDYAITAVSKDYVTYSGISVVNANSRGIYVWGASAGLTFAGIDSTNNWDQGILIVGATTSTLTGGTVSYNGSNGIALVDSPGFEVATSTVHHNCLLTDSDYTSGIKNNSATESSTDVIVRNNVVYSNGPPVKTGVQGAGIWSDTAGPRFTAKYNHVYGNTAYGIQVEAESSALIAYNVIHDNVWTGIVIGSSGGHMTANRVYNNVVYLSSPAFQAYGDDTAGCFTDNLVKNNIFLSSPGSPSLSARFGAENDGTNGSGNVYTNNALGVEGANFVEWGSTVYKATYDAWETAYGATTASVEADPLFVSTSDFHLQAGSPAINAGVDVGPALDFLGSPIYGLPDMGAYEYQPPLAPAGGGGTPRRKRGGIGYRP